MSETDDVVKTGPTIAVSRELLADAVAFDFTDMLLHPEKYPPAPEPTEPEVERYGDDYWLVVGSDTYEGTDLRGVYRTEAEVAYWRTLEHRRGVTIEGHPFDEPEET